MVCIDHELGAKQISSPLLQGTDNSQQLLFMYWVIKFGTLKHLAFECDRSGKLPQLSKGEYRSRSEITGICHNEDGFRCVCMVNGSQTLS